MCIYNNILFYKQTMRTMTFSQTGSTSSTNPISTDISIYKRTSLLIKLFTKNTCSLFKHNSYRKIIIHCMKVVMDVKVIVCLLIT